MSNIANTLSKIVLELDDNSILSNLFGVNDSNLQIIEKINHVKIEYRGNKIKISGDKESIFETKETILELFKEAKKGTKIDIGSKVKPNSGITPNNQSTGMVEQINV